MTCQALKFNGVSKSYAKKAVLIDINLVMAQGEFLGLVGANGAGKTTMIKCLLDFCSIDGGEITIFNKPHTNIESRRPLTFLPEKFMPPYYLTGKDFLIYMSRLHGSAYDLNIVRRTLAVLDFDEAALAKPVRQYSKGMGQKLGLAACLLSDKELFIMDEPMSGLDPKARAYLKQHLLELKQAGKTLFFSTHLLNDVEILCDKVAILHQGQVRFAGTPAACNEAFGSDNFEQAYLNCVEETEVS